MIQIEAVSLQPGLAPIVAGWLVDALHRYPGGMSLAAMTARILAPPDGPEETFMLFQDEQPAGTASLAAYDLDSRPDLTPWLAGVLVLPEFRGRGHAGRLVRAVADFARTQGVARLWLYTADADGLYAKLGWQRVGTQMGHTRMTVLMQRDLAQ